MVSLQCMYVFFFSFYLYFSILGVHLWFASFASLRTVNTVVILLPSQKNKNKMFADPKVWNFYVYENFCDYSSQSPHIPSRKL